jgi:putative endonuclease
MDRTPHVYILAGESGVLYTGVTNNLLRRFAEHKRKKIPGFTKKYNVTKLVWFEVHGRAFCAISREKEIKAWRRERKIALVEGMNPRWKDLTEMLQRDSSPAKAGSE